MTHYWRGKDDIKGWQHVLITTAHISRFDGHISRFDGPGEKKEADKLRWIGAITDRGTSMTKCRVNLATQAAALKISVVANVKFVHVGWNGYMCYGEAGVQHSTFGVSPPAMLTEYHGANSDV